MTLPVIAATPVALGADVTRLTAPNPGMMTGPGTNSYLVGTRDVILIDPGPVIDVHLEAIDRWLAEHGATLRLIACTHTHRDHSPAAAVLAQRFGVPCAGLPAPAGATQDESFRPDHAVADGDVLCIGDVRLRALHTPGHASNHVCWHLEGANWLFTGDHVMQGSTVVIAPPDGDMHDYLASLQRLTREPLTCLAPGHGTLIDDPQAVLQGLIRHRLMREAKVLGALTRLESGRLDDLVTQVYDDVPAFLHPVARHSLHAHLLKLQREARATEHHGLWSVHTP